MTLLRAAVALTVAAAAFTILFAPSRPVEIQHG